MTQELLATSLETEVKKKQVGNFGLIMIKPNATDSVLDPLITATFGGNLQSVFEHPGCDFINELDRITLCGQYYRDLSMVPYGDNLIDLFYSNQKGFRYFKMISDYYRGLVAFVLFEHDGNKEELSKFLENVKGEAETFDGNGNLVSPARGVRGALTIPYLFYSEEASNALNDEEYLEAFSPVVQNFIHVSDSPSETAAALAYLLMPHDVDNLEQRGFPISQFIKKYTSIVEQS